jgi:hypothetical protein
VPKTLLGAACTRGDEGSCRSLAHVQLELSRAEEAARACWALAQHFDRAWPPQVPKSKTYAKRACDHGEARGCRFEPNPLTVPSAGSGQSVGVIGGLINAITAPLRAIP